MDTCEGPGAQPPEKDDYEATQDRYNLDLFRDQYNVPWVRFPSGNAWETLEVKGPEFRCRLDLWFRKEPRDLKQAELREVQEKLAAMANGPRRSLELRSCWQGDRERGDLFIDLGDERGRAIQVRAAQGDWQVLDTCQKAPPCLFRREEHMQALPEPDSAGELDEMWKYLPLTRPEDRDLVLAWQLGAWLPMPRPVLMLVGQQGSGKSTLARHLRQLLDPSQVDWLGQDHRADWALTCFKHAVVLFDNVSRQLKEYEANLLCKATTGGGISRRVLYSDRREMVWRFQRPIILTALEVPTRQLDLLDRALIVRLEAMPQDRRATLARLESSFQAARPRLLGAMLNTLARALQARPRVNESGLGRLADWHHFGRAVAVARGVEVEVFDRAIQVMEERQRLGSVQGPLLLAVQRFAQKVGSWKGTAEKLLKELYDIAREEHISRTVGFWPESAVALGIQLKRYKDVLALVGVSIASIRNCKARLLVIDYDTEADTSSPDA